MFLYALKPHEIEGVSTLRNKDLAERIGEGYTVRADSNGPAGACVIVSRLEANRCRYNPDEQTWNKAPDGDYWIGHYKNELPKAKDLRRKQQIDGHNVELNGETWHVPAIRLVNGTSGLPESIQMDDRGKFATKPMQRYSAISSETEQLFKDFRIEIGIDEGTQTLTGEDRVRLAIDAIALNYHVSAVEVMILELLTTANLAEILAAVLDLPSIQKKTDGSD